MERYLRVIVWLGLLALSALLIAGPVQAGRPGEMLPGADHLTMRYRNLGMEPTQLSETPTPPGEEGQEPGAKTGEEKVSTITEKIRDALTRLGWPGLILLVFILVSVVVVGLFVLLRALRQHGVSSVTFGDVGSFPTGPYLESVSTAGQPRHFSLDKPSITIGRATDNDLAINETLVGWESASRHHARIYQEDAGQWVVEDLNSQNGVYVNGWRTGKNLLKEGWNVSLGDVEFVFHTGPAMSQATDNL